MTGTLEAMENGQRLLRQRLIPCLAMTGTLEVIENGQRRLD
ncbi:MAG TPA: hypothetical protein PL029_10155 [Bacteroidia bacterium]|nr:hypothetical protein [Bacteroidia bacterium]